MLIEKYHDSHLQDRQIRLAIDKAIDASPELRSKKNLIKNFLSGINKKDDIMAEFNSYFAEEKEKELKQIIEEENLKEEETREFINDCFRNGYVKNNGTDLDRILPPISRFGVSNARAKKKEKVREKIFQFFDKFYEGWDSYT